jgi:2-oxoglutarate dehydrogenase E1 component
MRKQQLNDVFALSSFLHGANAAYVEDLYARYQDNPGTVDAEWRRFFAGLKDQRDTVLAEHRGPSWKPDHVLVDGDSELLAALTGDWSGTAQEMEGKIRKRQPKAESTSARKRSCVLCATPCAPSC